MILCVCFHPIYSGGQTDYLWTHHHHPVSHSILLSALFTVKYSAKTTSIFCRETLKSGVVF